MDRNIFIKKGNLYVAELKITYDEQGKGKGILNPYEIVEYHDGSKNSHRGVIDYDVAINHPSKQTIDQLKAYDKSVLRENEQLIKVKESELTFLYELSVYRYIVHQDHIGLVGVAEFHADFNESTITFKFMSCRDMVDDWSMLQEANNHDAHKTTIENYCTTYLRDIDWVKAERVGRRWQ